MLQGSPESEILEKSLEIEKERQDRAKQEQDFRDRRERLRKKKYARFDYSEDMLVELNTLNLSHFYERSKRELDDFRDLFHQTKKIGPDLTDPSSTSPMRVIFEELCYLMRVTSDQVLVYQDALEKRIRDIEAIIDSHFNLIKPTLIQ